MRRLETPRGEVVERQAADGPLEGPLAFVEALAGSGCSTLAVDRSLVPAAFFDLRSGFAGEALQKVTNYRCRLILVGDWSDLDSRAWTDFRRESNRTGQVVFAATLDEGLALLR